MAILSKANFSGLYIDPSGTYANNVTGDITAADLRAGFKDFFDSETNFWPQDTNGIVASDSVSGLVGVDFASGLSAPAWREGRVFYDSDNHTFGLYVDMPDVTLQLGQETYIRVVNKTNAQIDNGTVVAITGAHGNRPTVEPAIASVDYQNIHNIIGIATHDIDINQEGLVTVRGTVGMNTSTLGDGSGLWLSPTTSGALTMIEPNAPNHSIKLGWSLNSTVAGKVLVDPQSNCTIEELSDVDGGISYNDYILAFNYASGYWNKTDRLNTSGGFKFGDVDNGNYTEFQEDTGFLRGHGSGRAWDDLRFPFTGSRIDVDGGRVDYNFSENTVDFESNATSGDVVNIIVQMQHDWAQGTDVHPHLHWIQNQDADPAWRMDYRVYNNGGQVPSWTTGVTPSEARQFTYTSGSILQLTEFPVISGATELSGFGVSWFMDVKIYRVGASDSYSGDASAKEFDLHYIRDDRGSRQEYIK